MPSNEYILLKLQAYICAYVISKLIILYLSSLVLWLVGSLPASIIKIETEGIISSIRKTIFDTSKSIDEYLIKINGPNSSAMFIGFLKALSGWIFICICKRFFG